MILTKNQTRQLFSQGVLWFIGFILWLVITCMAILSAAFESNLACYVPSTVLSLLFFGISIIMESTFWVVKEQNPKFKFPTIKRNKKPQRPLTVVDEEVPFVEPPPGLIEPNHIDYLRSQHDVKQLRMNARRPIDQRIILTENQVSIVLLFVDFLFTATSMAIALAPC